MSENEAILSIFVAMPMKNEDICERWDNIVENAPNSIRYSIQVFLFRHKSRSSTACSFSSLGALLGRQATMNLMVAEVTK